MTEWLKQNTVSIIVGGFGLIGGFYLANKSIEEKEVIGT